MVPLLRCFSCYSFGRGVLTPQALCRAAAARGVTHLALTDMGGVYGLVDFLRLSRESGLVPIAGATLSFAEGPVTFLAESKAGYASLTRLVTRYHGADEPVHLHGMRFDPSGLVILADRAQTLSGAVSCAGPSQVFAALEPGPRGVSSARCAERWGVRSVVAPHVYLSDPQDARVHRLQRAISLQTSLDRVPTNELWPVPGMVPHEEDARVWREAWPQAWACTMELAKRCAVQWEFERPILPTVCATREGALRRLHDLVEAGVRRRYPMPPPELPSRLERELAAIDSRGLSDYFLLVHEIVRTAGVSATCGRGSGASSLVAYCLGITEVDPIAANLYFERFLGPGRLDIPDIDVDFPWDERPHALQRLFASRPSGEVALVATHVTFRRRGAFREAGRVMGVPEAQLNDLWRQAERRDDRARPAPAPTTLLGRLLEAAALLRGLPRHLSRHCGGVVIVPGGVDRVVPYEPLPDGLRVIQWEKDQSEDAGLVKIDLLGNRSLSVVRDGIRWVNDAGCALAYETLNPLEDRATRDLLARGDTMGIFYVESPAMRQLQAKAATGAFESLVVHSSLIRPAANRWIAEYVRRLHGAPYERIHPFLDELLAESKGILCYQEDVMRVAVELAGFDHRLADQLRRTLSGKRGIPLADLEARFKEGLRCRGFGEEHVGALWSMVESFAGYSFCKAHSASYALLSFKSAYLKAHHPQAFMAAVLSNGGGYYSAQAYVSEARRMGLAVHGPDVNRSAVEYLPTSDGIRVGLGQIKALGTEGARRLVESRADGAYVSLEDVLSRCPLPVQAAQGLILAGALDTLHGPGCRIPLLRRLADLSVGPRRRDLLLIPPPATWYENGVDARLARMQEMETLGFPLEGHPLDLVEPPAGAPDDSLAIPRRVGRRVRLLGWYVTAKPVETRHGDDMAFVSFEDRHSIFEAVLFPEPYRRYRHDLVPDRAYVVEGTVAEDSGVCTVEVERLGILPRIAYALPGAGRSRRPDEHCLSTGSVSWRSGEGEPTRPVRDACGPR